MNVLSSLDANLKCARCAVFWIPLFFANND